MTNRGRELSSPSTVTRSRPRLVGNSENQAEGQRISDDSITLVRDNGKLLPLKPNRPDKSILILYQRVKPVPRTALIILCDRLRAEDGHVLERQVLERSPDTVVIYVDPHVVWARSPAVLKAVTLAREVIVAVYVVPSAARTRTVARGQSNPASLPDSTAWLLTSILARAPQKTAVLAMGDPYLTSDFPAIQNYISTFSNATVSEISAAKALFGEIPISGHLPVTFRTSIKATDLQPPAKLTGTGSPAGDLRPVKAVAAAVPQTH